MQTWTFTIWMDNVKLGVVAMHKVTLKECMKNEKVDSAAMQMGTLMVWMKNGKLDPVAMYKRTLKALMKNLDMNGAATNKKRWHW